MLRVDYRFDGHPRRLFAKYEQESMTASVERRMAGYILRRAHENKDLPRSDAMLMSGEPCRQVGLASVIEWVVRRAGQRAARRPC